MFKNTELQEDFKKYIEDIKAETEELKKIYDSFFDFNIILTSDTGSKTAVNREYIYESNQSLKESTAIINATFDEMFLSFKKYILDVIPKKHHDSFELSSFIFDNQLFLAEISNIVKDDKIKNVINNILFIKDKLYTLKYVLKKANTLAVCKKLNKMNMNELQNSQSIFKIIDHLGILANNFSDFYNRIDKFEENYADEVDLDLNFLDSIVLTEMLNLEEFIHQNRKYRFLLDYTNLSNQSKQIKLEKVYFENILSNLIEQSCLDVLKKERVSSKSDRTISIKANYIKDNLILSCTCDGIYNRNLEDNNQIDIENKALMHSKNLLDYIDGQISINEIGSLLEYKVTVKLNKDIKVDENN